jgi:hypothetical protein
LFTLYTILPSKEFTPESARGVKGRSAINCV